MFRIFYICYIFRFLMRMQFILSLSLSLSLSSPLVSRLFALFGASPRLVNFPEMYPNTVAIVRLSRGAPPSATRSLGPHLDLRVSNLRMTNVNSRKCNSMFPNECDIAGQFTKIFDSCHSYSSLRLFLWKEKSFHRDSCHSDKRFVIAFPK